jgi:hypothetical protein
MNPASRSARTSVCRASDVSIVRGRRPDVGVPADCAGSHPASVTGVGRHQIAAGRSAAVSPREDPQRQQHGEQDDDYGDDLPGFHARHAATIAAKAPEREERPPRGGRSAGRSAERSYPSSVLLAWRRSSTASSLSSSARRASSGSAIRRRTGCGSVPRLPPHARCTPRGCRSGRGTNSGPHAVRRVDLAPGEAHQSACGMVLAENGMTGHCGSPAGIGSIRGVYRRRSRCCDGASPRSGDLSLPGLRPSPTSRVAVVGQRSGSGRRVTVPRRARCDRSMAVVGCMSRPA